MTRYTVRAKVKRVFEQKDKKYQRGVGEGATFIERSAGWYVVFDGSWEALYFGTEAPDFAANDEVEISFMKAAA